MGRGPVPLIGIYCRACGTKLYSYRKRGKGSLVKCFLDRIVVDHTPSPESGKCPNDHCGAVFARPIRIAGRPANKIIGGKVFVKGR